MIRFCIALLAALGCSGLAVAYDWQVGERLTYDVGMGWLKAGQAEFQLDKKGEFGNYNIYVRAWTGKAAGTVFSMHDRIHITGTCCQMLPFVPSTFSQELFENEYRAHKTVEFNHVKEQAIYENKLNKNPPKTLDIQAGSRDVMSALYAFRSQPKKFKVGTTLELPVVQLDRQYSFKLKVLDKEEMDTILGRKTVWKLQPIFQKVGEPKPNESDWIIWATADDVLIPVQFSVDMNLGKITAKLTELNGPSRAPKTLPLTGEIQPPNRFRGLVNPE